MALLRLAATWASHHRRPLQVLTVDHGLSPDSRRWAGLVQEAAAALGLGMRVLRWTGEKPTVGIPASARAARHALLADAARETGARVVLMGHTADDAREGEVMRAEGSTLGRLRDWSPSPAWPRAGASSCSGRCSGWGALSSASGSRARARSGSTTRPTPTSVSPGPERARRFPLRPAAPEWKQTCLPQRWNVRSKASVPFSGETSGGCCGHRGQGWSPHSSRPRFSAPVDARAVRAAPKCTRFWTGWAQIRSSQARWRAPTRGNR
jgi:hypothetical protein